ncbi:F-box/RNI/FBD-like domain protein, partial [Trifolium pratense]
VLLSRDAELPIHTFHFDVEYDSTLQCPIKSITKWVNFVLQRGVENLHLGLFVGTNSLPKLPVRILACTTLVNLQLSGLTMDKGYSSVLLPSLKTLQLGFICFPKLRDLMLFLSGCPILQ